MAITKEDIIKKIKKDDFGSRDFSKDVVITIQALVSYFPESQPDEIRKLIYNWKEVNIDGSIITISKECFK